MARLAGSWLFLCDMDLGHLRSLRDIDLGQFRSLSDMDLGQFSWQLRLEIE